MTKVLIKILCTEICHVKSLIVKSPKNRFRNEQMILFLVLLGNKKQFLLIKEFFSGLFSAICVSKFCKLNSRANLSLLHKLQCQLQRISLKKEVVQNTRYIGDRTQQIAQKE